jgi:hypothetical protein
LETERSISDRVDPIRNRVISIADRDHAISNADITIENRVISIQSIDDAVGNAVIAIQDRDRDSFSVTDDKKSVTVDIENVDFTVGNVTSAEPTPLRANRSRHLVIETYRKSDQQFTCDRAGPAGDGSGTVSRLRNTAGGVVNSLHTQP